MVNDTGIGSLDRVRSYYDGFNEWRRLKSAPGKLEFLRTMRIVESSIEKGASVLDLGGGPGRYTIALARAGFRPSLADLSPGLIKRARKRIQRAGCANEVEAIEVVDGRSLACFPDDTFDAVLALGPYYHLVTDTDRLHLASEIRRASKPGAWIAVAFLPRLAGVRGLIQRSATRSAQVPEGTLLSTLKSGVFHNGERWGFQEGWYAEPTEIRDLFEGAGCKTLSMVSVKGVAAGQEKAVLRLRKHSEAAFEEVLDVIKRTQERPELVGSADHALWIGRVS